MKMYDDVISKPSAGRYFPITAKEVAETVKRLSFQVYSPDDRLQLMFQNCDYKAELGYQLASLLRMGYLAVFSLPESITNAAGRNALRVALEEFAAIDRGPRKTTNEQQFVIYRAYLGELSTVLITEDVIQAGHRRYLLFRKVVQVTRGNNQKHHERVLRKVNSAQPGR